ncbi:unnamed protein product [Paramecium octaurelia]|uniref:Uncharacterized protein n=1 Tax=Paramecium octaurelia TaxID=43137 RepID=A0A8S1UX97_PAROT|nr:unnamed protein product [Paramecium octaurelia]
MIVVEPSQYNQYLIKSLLNNQFFTIDKQDLLKYSQITAEQCSQEFHWTIISVDQLQNFNHKYSLRFGEFIQMTTNKPQNQNQTLSKVTLLIQLPDKYIISGQSFSRLKDILVQKQPCVLQRSDDNLYLTIEKDRIIFLDYPNLGSYFQLIPLNDSGLKIQRDIIKFQYEYEIRNYVTGYSLNIKQDSVNFKSPLLSVIRSNKKNEKWQLIEQEDFHNQFQFFNFAHKLYIHTEEIIVNLISANPPKINWEIQTIDNQEFSYGVPFTIQNSFTKNFLTMNAFNLKCIHNFEQEVFQSEQLQPESLWIIFQHQI